VIGVLVVFGLTYVAISAGGLPRLKLDRPSAALGGAVGMVLMGALTLEQAYAAINLDTLLLLFGMLTLSALLLEARFFDALAAQVVRSAGTPRRLLLGIILVAGGMSALLVNDTVCVMFTPLVVAVAEQSEVEPLPLLLGLTTAANLGGVVTLTGNPQNMIVGTVSGIAYGDYLLRLLPVGVLGLVADYLILCLLFRRELAPRALHPGVFADRTTHQVDRRLGGMSLLALLLIVAGFLWGRSLAGTAVAGCALPLLFGGPRARRALEKVGYGLLVFFASLFVVVEGLRRSGGLDWAVGHLAAISQRPGTGLVGLAAVTTLGSNLVSNVPFVLCATHVPPAMPNPRQAWMVLAMASTLAGNLTIFGSVANIIVLESAGRHGKVGFWRFLRVGAPVTLVTLAIGLGVLWLEQRMGFG
jgi:Na+/H+ antiporter NhaD/arsenite permease-like protein